VPLFAAQNNRTVHKQVLQCIVRLTMVCNVDIITKQQQQQQQPRLQHCLSHVCPAQFNCIMQCNASHQLLLQQKILNVTLWISCSVNITPILLVTAGFCVWQTGG
jgi:hypothetical protein